MALGSNAPRCAARDCPEQLRFDVHQLHHEGLADMRPSFNRELGTMGERCRAQRGCAKQRATTSSSA